MRAAVFYGDHDVRVEEVTSPTGPGPGEVLVRPYWCGICGTDLHEYAMGPIVIPSAPHPLNCSELPQILGHEFSAEVVAVGAGVTSVREGQRVSVMPLLYCGALLLLPSRAEPPVRVDGLHRAELRVGRHRRARGPAGPADRRLEHVAQLEEQQHVERDVQEPEVEER